MNRRAHLEAGRLDLHDVLSELGRSPEGFARFIDRNGSGFRRIIYGQQAPNRDTAKDIVKGLLALGFKDDPRRIWQLMNIPPGIVESARHELRMSRQTPAAQEGASASETPVSQALANLMRALGRKEVDRVYEIMFGTRPNEKDS